MRTCVHVIKSANLECRSICEIVRGLAKFSTSYRYQLTVLFLNDGPLLHVMQDANIPAHVIAWAGNSSHPAGAYHFLRWLRTHPADIVHLHHGGRLPRILALTAGSKAVVHHTHGRINESSLRISSPSRIQYADAVIACSHAAAENVVGQQVVVIYSGIHIDAEVPAAPKTGNFLRMGVLCRLTPVKNIATMIEATALLLQKGINVRLEIVGTGPSEPDLHALVANRKLEESVRFLGWRDDVAPLLASWDVLTMPSIDEGFPVAVLQAMAAARPIVATRVGGLVELVVDGVTGRLTPPDNLQALVECLGNLAQNREALAAMGRAGWERARQQFSAESMAQQTFQLYDQLVGGVDTHAA